MWLSFLGRPNTAPPPNLLFAQLEFWEFFLKHFFCIFVFCFNFAFTQVSKKASFSAFDKWNVLKLEN